MFAAEQASHSMYLNDQVNRKNTNKKYVMTSQVKLYSLRFWACGSPTTGVYMTRKRHTGL